MKKICLLIIGLILVASCSRSEDRFPKIDPNGTPQVGVTPDDNTDPNTDDTPTPQVNNVDDITLEFETLMTQYGLQGAQIAITRNSQLVYLESFGKADIEEGDLVNENSLFRIASISKPITVMAISKLIADNKLSLEENVFGSNAILGEEYGTPPYEADEQAITISHLIEHRAGFTDNPSDIMYDDAALTLSDLIGKVLDERSLTYVPGATYEYSNFGYALLGRIIEKTSGTTYENYVKDNLLGPMGIANMNIALNSKAEAFENEVQYYSNWTSPYDLNVNRMDSHDGWVSSAKSLALFAIFSDGNSTIPDLLTSEASLSYLANGSWRHDGALPGTISVMNVGYPVSYVVLVNRSEANFIAMIRIISEFMDKKIKDTSEWPTENLFDTQ